MKSQKNGLVGLKWTETRLMFGKQATETMWITDAEENDYYQTRAESHGSIYISRLEIKDSGDGTELTMSFEGNTSEFWSQNDVCFNGLDV